MSGYKPLNIGAGDSPRNRDALKNFWDIVSSVPSVEDAKMNLFWAPGPARSE